MKSLLFYNYIIKNKASQTKLTSFSAKQNYT